MNDAKPDFDVCVIGGGPAGLAAAEAAAAAGARVLVAEQKPSIGRKLLMAGKSGLNLTKDEPAAAFRARVGHGAALAESLAETGPREIIAWAEGLGQPVFTGSSGRVFPRAMKASPLLRAWIGRLTGAGVEIRTRWRWAGWENAATVFKTPEGVVRVTVGATVLACGGGSWARLGSDGRWTEILGAQIALDAFRPSNMGFLVDWSEPMRRFAGFPVKGVRLSAGAATATGDCVISTDGIEGGAVYEISAALRDAMITAAGGVLTIDLLPDLSLEAITARLAHERGKLSVSNYLRKRLRLPPVKVALLREGGPLSADPHVLAARVKALPLRVTAPRPIDEAISTAGGVPEAALDTDLMLREKPGVFCAGEMIGWDAPTGGYLITTCLATGWHAGSAAARFATGRR